MDIRIFATKFAAKQFYIWAHFLQFYLSLNRKKSTAHSEFLNMSIRDCILQNDKFHIRFVFSLQPFIEFICTLDYLQLQFATFDHMMHTRFKVSKCSRAENCAKDFK